MLAVAGVVVGWAESVAAAVWVEPAAEWVEPVAVESSLTLEPVAAESVFGRLHWLKFQPKLAWEPAYCGNHALQTGIVESALIAETQGSAVAEFGRKGYWQGWKQTRL